jgi:anthranilate synthase component I
VPFRARPVDVYRALRALNPSPYMYFLDLGETQVVGSSPEILVRLQGGEVTVRPIAGTRPRGATPKRTRAGSRAAGRSEGARRAPDADRPGPQRRRPGAEPGSVRSASSSSSSATAT